MMPAPMMAMFMRCAWGTRRVLCRPGVPVFRRGWVLSRREPGSRCVGLRSGQAVGHAIILGFLLVSRQDKSQTRPIKVLVFSRVFPVEKAKVGLDFRPNLRRIFMSVTMREMLEADVPGSFQVCEATGCQPRHHPVRGHQASSPRHRGC